MHDTESAALRRVLDALRSRNCGPHPSGAGWCARCPAHDDRSPSLSIGLGDDGRALIHCQAGCSTEAVVDALGLRMADLMLDDSVARFSGALARAGAKRQAAGAAKPKYPTPDAAFEAARKQVEWELRKDGDNRAVGKPDRVWEYKDANGSVVGYALRWIFADIGKRTRPVANLGNGWAVAAMPVPRPLLGLLEVGANPTATVAVVEGEPCVDAARSLGYVATTWSGGSSAAPKTDWSPLAGRDVVIHADNDEPGRKAASAVLDILTRLDPPARVRVAPMLGDAPGFDVADFVAAGGTREQLDALTVEATTTPTPKVEAKPPTGKQAKRLDPLPARRPFPVECLPQPLRGFVVAESKAKHVPPEMVAAPVIAVAAAAIGDSRTLQLKPGWREPCIVWLAVVAEPSTNKTAPFKAALAPMEQTEDRWAVEHSQAMVEFEKRKTVHEAELAAWKRKPDGDPPEKPEEPICPRVVVADITTEALAVRLQENPRGLLLAMDELAGWLASYDAYRQGRGGDAQRWLQIWSAGRIIVDRKSGGTVRVPRSIVSVCGTVQPETLRRAYGTEHIDDGLAARLLVAYPPTTAVRWTHAESSPEVTRRYAELLDRLLLLPTRPGDDPFDARRPYVARLSDAAKRLYVPWHNRVAAEAVEQPGALRSVWGKLRGYAARLALVCHTVRAAQGEVDDLTLDADSIQAGMLLAEWFGNEARRLFTAWAGDDDDRELRQIADWIAQRGGSATVRNVQRNGPRRFRDAAESYLRRLVESGLATWEGSGSPEGGGHASRSVRLMASGDSDTRPEFLEENESSVASRRRSEPEIEADVLPDDYDFGEPDLPADDDPEPESPDERQRRHAAWLRCMAPLDRKLLDPKQPLPPAGPASNAPSGRTEPDGGQGYFL